MRNTSKTLFIASGLSLMSMACGEKAATKIDENAPSLQQSQQNAGVSGCSALSCAPATMQVSADGKTDAGLLVGVVGEPVPWSFNGVAAETGREVAVLLNKIPQGAVIDPPQDGLTPVTSVKIVWTAQAAQKSKDPIEVYARDLTRCQMIEGNGKCGAAKVMKKYDVLIASVPWEIVPLTAVQGPTASEVAGVSAPAHGVKAAD